MAPTWFRTYRCSSKLTMCCNLLEIIHNYSEGLGWVVDTPITTVGIIEKLFFPSPHQWKGYQNELHILVSFGWIFRPLCKMLVIYSYPYHYYIPKNYKSCVVGTTIARHGIQAGGKFVFPKYRVFSTHNMGLS